MRDQSLRRLGVDGRVKPGHDDGASGRNGNGRTNN
jgi:hypothetical protein